MTALWHEQQKAIQAGERDAVSFVTELMEYICSEVAGVKQNGIGIKVNAPPCPDCGKPLRRIKKKDKNEFFWGCTGFADGCKYACEDKAGKPVAKQALLVSELHRCKSCGKGLSRRTGKKKGTFWWGVVVFQSANKHTLTLRVNQITTLTNMVVTMSDEHNEKKTGDSVVLSVVDSILNVEENNADNFGDNADSVDVLNEKMIDAMTPGAMVEFDPDEAERIGAFQEDALDESDALESSIDLEDIG
jgi:hypothetical protein